MSNALPKVIHSYQNHHLNSTRWGRYRPRPNDLVMATSYRSGTTWLQESVRRLLFWQQEDPAWRQLPLRRAAASHGSYRGMKGGPQACFFKGSNGRWQGRLSAEELALY